MTVIDSPRVDTVILDETILNDQPKCESTHCQLHGRGSHPATYTVRLSCGIQMLACATRVREYKATEKLIKCTKCGGQLHMTADFGFTPL